VPLLVNRTMGIMERGRLRAKVTRLTPVTSSPMKGIYGGQS
jgi:hypothetical protein